MPELPEVETIVCDLRHGSQERPGLVGLVLKKVEVFWERSLTQPALTEFKSRVPGQVVQDVQRRGKFIVIRLNQDTLLIHLRMSGDLRVIRDTEVFSQHDRIAFLFDNGWMLVFNDPRKFGRVWLVPDPQVILNSLGPEPLDPVLTVDRFYQMLHGRQSRLKSLLLNQDFIAGLGNIYSDEALYLASLNPMKNADSLTRDQAEKLLISIRQVLSDGIGCNGASIDWVYRGGGYQNKFRVYHRTGQACPTCGTLIQRFRLGQRSTHFCPVCQPL